MSAPDRVDVGIPNTLESKMVSRKSTENLRHVVVNSHGKNHHHIHAGGPESMNNSNNNVSAGHHDQNMAGTHREMSTTPGKDSSSSHHSNHDQNLPFGEYCAWTIGSTEGLLRNSSHSSYPQTTSSAASPNQSAILARHANGSMHKRPSTHSPDLSDMSVMTGNTAGTGGTVNSANTGDTANTAHTVMVTPQGPTSLGGLSQNMIDGHIPRVGNGNEEMHAQLRLHQQQQNKQYHHSNSGGLPPIPSENQFQHPQNPTQQSQHYYPPFSKPLQQLYHSRLLNQHLPTNNNHHHHPESSTTHPPNHSNPIPSSITTNYTLQTTVESLLSSSCEAMGFDIAEMWLRTGPKTHQLTNSHVRPTALDESVRKQVVDVYYGERSAERTHRLSPALCKRAKEAGDVVWVTAHTLHGAEALKCSISDVRTAVAVPVCHGGSDTNITIIYFSIRRAIMKPQAVEFLVHMSLATAAAAVNPLAEEVMVDAMPTIHFDESVGTQDSRYSATQRKLSKSEHVGDHSPPSHKHSVSISRDGPHRIYSVTGAQLNLQWDSLRNVEYLTDGGNNWIHTAVLHGKSVVVKTLKPECQDVALAINEIEGELEIHSRLDHSNIVSLIGAGFTPRGVRFVVLERLDGGTLTQLLGYDNRIRDRRRRFWAKKKISYMDVLKCARSLADALAYCHGRAIPNAMVLHRDLKPDNVGFTLDGTVKLIDFGLARIVENASVSNDVYEMSGETGSLRYMAPEVADCQPYNQKADVYSFGKSSQFIPYLSLCITSFL